MASQPEIRHDHHERHLFARLGRGIGDFFRGRDDSVDPLAENARHLFQVKHDLLEQVRHDAQAAGLERPTLEMYRKATVAFAQTEEGKAMVARGEWSPAIAADLHGQNLKGFAISDPFTRNGDKRPTTDLLDQDADGTIGEFYTNVNFNEANLKNAYVDPATSFNEEIAKAKHLSGLTFNGMEAPETFTFAAGRYDDIRMTGINGGTVQFATSAMVDGLTLEGKQAGVVVAANARVEHIEVGERFRIVTLDLEKGGVIANSDLKDALVSPTSHIRGTLQNVQLNGDVRDLDLRGATLRDVTIDGQPITSAKQLQQMGVAVDASTTISASPDFLREHQMKFTNQKLDKVVSDLAKALQDLNPNITSPAMASSAAAASLESTMALKIDFENKAARIIKAAVELNPSGTRPGDTGMIAEVRLAAQDFTSKYADIINNPDQNTVSNAAILNMPKPKELIRDSGMPLPPLPHRVNG